MAGERKHAYMFDKKDPEILYITCIPWIHYTHFVRSVEGNESDVVPRISWGKYRADREGRIWLPLSVQVHHAMMDGYHVGRYFETVEAWLGQLEP